MHINEGLRLRRKFAEAIHNFFLQGVDLVVALGRGQFLVEAEPQMDVATKIIGQQRRGVQVDVGGDMERTEQVWFNTGPETAYRFRQHFVVQLKSDLHHVAALVFTQDLPGAANLQIMHGEIEAAAQFFHLLNRFQALTGLLGQTLQIGHHQVSVGLVMATSDSATQLVQLGQAKLVRAAHDDGVGTGNVNTGLDDGGTEQQVESLCHKIAHHQLELALRHLTVGDGDACFR